MRPRDQPPRADSVVEMGAKTYFLRLKNGILHFRESARDDANWTFAISQIPDTNADLELFFRENIARGNVARVVLLPFKGEFQREFPLFLGADGSGFCREAWNRDDLNFSHDLSLHQWLESPANALFSACEEIFKREIEPQLENLSFPAGRNLPLSFDNGSRAELSAITSHILALETGLESEGIVRATCQSESFASRAGFYEVSQGFSRVETRFDAQNGERFRLSWKNPTLKISRRCWTLSDWAIDAITPRGVLWDYLDKGAGRTRENPHPREFSLQFIVSKLPDPSESRDFLHSWARQNWPLQSVKAVLNDDEIADFEIREEAV